MEIQDRKFTTFFLTSIISFLFAFSSCKGKTDSIDSQVIKTKLVKTDLETVENQFNLFKKFVVNGKKNEAKMFFDFPIKSDDLWYKVLDDEAVEKQLGNLFNEKDFEIYFDKIFNKSFKECLSDIDVQQLFEHGKFSTKLVTAKENSYLVKNQIEATYSNGELRLIFNSILQNQANEFEAEHTEFYTFVVIGNKLKFSSFNMAG